MEDIPGGDGEKWGGRLRGPDVVETTGFDAICADLDDGIVEYMRSAWFGRRAQLCGLCNPGVPRGECRRKRRVHRRADGCFRPREGQLRDLVDRPVAFGHRC